jgi:hypothetical protein
VTALAIRDETHYLATVDEVRALAEQITHVSDAKELADRAQALRVWAQRQRLGLEKVNLATAAMLWAQRREGELLVEMRESGERAAKGGDQRSEGSSRTTRLEDLGVDKHEASRAMKLADIPADEFAELVDEMVPEGRITQAEILRRAKRREREAKKAEEEAALVAKVNEAGGVTWRVTASDIRDFNPGPVDAIVTDPPYITADAVELYAALRDLALRILKPGGAIVAMTWQPILFDVGRALAHPDLRYRWTVAWVSGAHETTADHARRVNDRWKPVLVYHRGKWAEKAGMLTDVVSTDRDAEKGQHAWQQGLNGFRQLIRAVSKPGDVICDPFVGGGTTALAALAEERHFVGCDIDAHAVDTTHARLAA